jgi:hypothetical protein
VRVRASASCVNLGYQHWEGTFMRTAAGVILTALAAIAVAACGGSSGSTASTSVPHLSAASACSTFASWRQQTQGNPTDWGKRVILLLATSQAPSGQLYADLFTLESYVITSHATGRTGQAYANLIPSATHTVARDCQSVNPGS